MPIPTRDEYRAAFAEALQQQSEPTDAQASHVIRAAVEVVLGDPADDARRPTTARHRANFLALADAIQGKTDV
jgi:hypothetical protein